MIQDNAMLERAPPPTEVKASSSLVNLVTLKVVKNLEVRLPVQ